MKHNQQKKIKKITISLFFTLSIFVLFGQSIPMVAESNVWYERGEYGGWGPYPEQDRYITHYFEGDTIINGQSYKKLYEDFRDTIFSTPVFIQDHFSYEAAMRQDGALVYYILPGNTAEALYADFNIGLGDTLNYFQNTQNATVVAIDSFQLGSETISSYQLSNGAYFYEAIGGSFGPFRDYSIGIEGGTYLVCFHYYQNSVGVGP